MPGYAWGIPAEYCQRGSKLREIPGTPCHSCYAFKYRYAWPNVKNAYERRYQGLNHPQWVEAMVFLIRNFTSIAVPYFRWFDSGDLQSFDHLLKIIDIVQQTPEINHWLPTQEHGFVRRLKTDNIAVPENLVIRVSATFIDGPPPIGVSHTSGVVSTKGDQTCPSMYQNNKCLDCRACWDTEVNHVSYHQH